MLCWTSLLSIRANGPSYERVGSDRLNCRLACGPSGKGLFEYERDADENRYSCEMLAMRGYVLLADNGVPFSK